MTRGEPAGEYLQRLICYYAACIRGGSEGHRLWLSEVDSYRLLPDSRAFEQVGQGVWVGPVLRDLLMRISDSGRMPALNIGHPTIVFEPKNQRGSHRRRAVAAVASYELRLPPAGVELPDRIYVEDEEAVETVNPKPFRELGCEEYEVERVMAAVNRHLASGPLAAARLREILSDEVGLDLPALGSVRDESGLRPGIYDLPLVWLGESSVATRALLGELAYLTSSDNLHSVASSLAGVLVDEPPAEPPAPAKALPLVTPVAINQAQEEAIRSAFSRRVTAVTGPPGTGKSQFITNLVATCWLHGQRVLVASTNNQAVDVVCDRLGRRHPGLLVRTGKSAIRDEAMRLVERLGQTPKPPRSAGTIRADILSGWRKVEHVRTHLAEREAVDRELSGLLDERESLLAELDLPAALVAGWEWKRVRKWLARATSLRTAWFLGRWRRTRFLGSLGVVRSQESFPMALRLLHLEDRRRALETSSLDSADALMRRLRRAAEDHVAASGELLVELAAAQIGEGQAELRENMAVVGRPVKGAVKRFRSLSRILPAWATTTHSAGSITRGKEVVDILVIDEASQCTISACIPLLYRAKRVVVVGDPRQLGPVTGISERPERAALRRHRLDQDELEAQDLLFSNSSIYDALSRQAEEVILLDEHYRCHPRIIGLSNRLFYGNRLSILTNPEALSSDGLPAMAWHEVRGRVLRPEGGGAHNLAEAEIVIEMLRELLAVSGPGEVGVVTPFRAQANLLIGLVEDQLSPELIGRLGDPHEAIGTVHVFQGGERRAIVFSPVISDGVAPGTARWLASQENENLLNVSLTRARAHFVGVGDAGVCRAQGGALAELVEVALRGGEDPYEVALDRGELHSDAEKRVYEELLRQGLAVSPKARWHHLELDFLISGPDGVRLNLEVDGPHHGGPGRLRSRDMGRDDLLEKNGFRVLRVPDWRCRSSPREVVTDAVSALDPGAL